ncbi:hypothetical protein K439DRAFT_1621001 [Ramaria rubella]|nr:hypothetical protein K439DRAFT_1621001 [Ramaria rubella]
MCRGLSLVHHDHKFATVVTVVNKTMTPLFATVVTVANKTVTHRGFRFPMGPPVRDLWMTCNHVMPYGQASNQSHSTVTTGSVILECQDDSNNLDISASNANNTNNAKPSTSTTTTSTPSTSSPLYYKVAAGKKRPTSNTGKTGNIPKTP